MAGGALIGALRVTLGLDSATFDSGLNRAATNANQAGGRIQRTLGGIGTAAGALKGALAGMAAGFAISGLQQIIADGLDYASSLGEVAQQLGVTTETLQVYRYAATQVGVEQETMDKGLAKLTVTIGAAAEGGKKQEAAFRALGISVRDVNGEIRTTDDVLPDIIRGLSGIESPAKRAAIEVALFGKAGQQLDTLLAGGVGQIDQLRDAAHRLGIVLSEEQIANADQTADKLSELQLVLKTNISGAVANNASAIYDLADAFVTLAARALSAWQQMSNWENLQIARSPMLGRLSALQGGPTQEQARRSVMGNQAGRRDLFMDARRDWQNATDPTARRIAYARAQAIHDEEMRSRVGRPTRTARPAALLDETKPVTGGRGRSGGGGGRAGGAGGRSGPTLAEQAQQALDRLFPDDAQRRELEEKMAVLGKAVAAKAMPVGEYERAKAEILRQLAAIPTEAQRLANMAIIKAPEFGPLADGAIDAEVVVSDRWRTVIAANDSLKESFADTTREVAISLNGLLDNARSGDWLSAFEGLVGIFSQLGQAGLFGAKIQTNLKVGLAGARAAGGPVTAGLPYLVGERGPEVVVPGMSGNVIPNSALGGGGGRPVYFDARGAVMTTDLLAQMQIVANDTGGRLIARNNADQAFAGKLSLRGR